MKWVILMLAGVLCGTAAADPVSDNAAFFYWKAIGVMRIARTPEHLEALRFMEEELPRLPPRILEARPSILKWLLSEQAVRDLLRQASACSGCDFGVRLRGGPFLDVAHLPRMALLCRRVCAMAQALDFAGREAEAAQAYVGLLNMIRRLEAEQTAASGLAAAEMMQSVLLSLEGFIVGEPVPEALAVLTNGFGGVAGPPFNPASWLRDEAERLSAWLRQDPAGAMELMRPRIGSGPLAPAVERAASEAASEDSSVFDGWLSGYRERMDRLARAMEQPFRKGAPELLRLDAERAKWARNPESAPNPLFPLLVPAVAEMDQRCRLARAQWDMADLLCAAAARRAREGKWPDRLPGRRVPRDPFSGERLSYRLVRGRPVMGVRIPKEMAETGRYLYLLDLARRAREDEDRFGEAIARARALEFGELFEPAAP